MITKRTYGRPFRAEIDVYDECKYTADAETFENCKTVTYEDVESWDIVEGDDAREIEAHTDGSCIDDHHEYLVLHFTSGGTGTFRNSYVDMFKIGWSETA